MARLTGCSVLEVGEYVGVPYGGKLLSDLGATVTKIEPPDGDVARHVGPYGRDEPTADASEFFAYLNTGKRSVTLPPDGETSADVLRDLIEHADVDLVIEDRLADYGIDPEVLANEVDDLSVVSVSGFGATGPFQEYDAPDIVTWAQSGHMNKMGYPDSPPARLRIKATEYWVGQLVAISGLSAVLDTRLQEAPGGFVDLARREVATSSMEHFIAGYSWCGEPTERIGAGYPNQGDQSGFPTIFETREGYVSASPIGPGRFETFAEDFLGRPELLEDPRFESREARSEHRDDLIPLIVDYLEDQEKWDIFERFQAVGIPAAVTSTPKDVAEFDHLAERGFWEEVPLPNGDPVTMPGFPFLVNDERPSQERAPRLGEHNDVLRDLGFEYVPTEETLRPTGEGPAPTPARRGSATGSGRAAGDGGRDERDGDRDDRPLPLDGIKVLDLSWVYAGPHGSKLLAALGADVVKVESEQKPDSVRAGFTYQYDAGLTSNVSAYFNEQNQGKRDINLDLTNERGRELALELVAEADVLMENYSPSFMDRVDLDYETIREINPEIVYLSMPGWGKTGPAKSYRAYGLTIQSMAGLDWVSGHPDDPPTTSGHSWPDPTGGHMGALAVLASLFARERTGEGASVESALFEVTVAMAHKPIMEYVNNGRLPERTGNRDEDGRYVQGVYPCAGEDDWAVVAVETDGQWARLCDAMDRPDLASVERFATQYDRLANHDAVDQAIADWTRERSREEVRERLQDRDVPAGIVADERDLVEYDPQLRVRDYFSVHDHPEVGTRTYQGFPFRMADHDVRFRTRAPLFGEHTEEVLAEWLGMGEEDIEAAEAAEALF